jgi:DEAD/DEAH box helicase domain-containing protein
VRSEVSKFKKLRFHTHENIGYGEISVPEEQMHTRSVALVFTADTVVGNALHELPKKSIATVIARLGTVVKNVSPVFLLCDPGDIGVSERLKDPHFLEPALYIFDTYPGGSGIAEGFVDKVSSIRAAARELVAQCPCDEGCPSCVGPRDTEREIGVNPKQAVLDLLDVWSGAVSNAVRSPEADSTE